MHINRGSIGGLIGVHVSNIVKLGYQYNFKLVSFYEKISCTQKAPKRKTSKFHPRSLCVKKIVALVVQCLLNFALLVNVCLWVFLCAGNLSVKKTKKNLTWNCFDSLILLYYLCLTVVILHVLNFEISL